MSQPAIGEGARRANPRAARCEGGACVTDSEGGARLVASRRHSPLRTDGLCFIFTHGPGRAGPPRGRGRLCSRVCQTERKGPTPQAGPAQVRVVSR